MGQTSCLSKSWVFKICFPFKVKQHSQQQLNLQYKACSILYKMVGAPSFFTTLLVDTTGPSFPTNNLFPSAALNFHLPISPPYLLYCLTILTIPIKTLFLYTRGIFHLPIFPYSQSNNLHQKYFPYLIQSANSGSIKGSLSKWVLCWLTLF